VHEHRVEEGVGEQAEAGIVIERLCARPAAPGETP
jgi:hypothetical protein